MTDFRLRTLHAGLGTLGLHCLEIARAHPLFEVVGLVDPEPAAREQACARFGFPPELAFEELDAAVAECDPDAVLVTIPAALRSDLIIQVLAADLHVLSAHPFAVSDEEARRCATISLNRGVRLMVLRPEGPTAEQLEQFHAYVTQGVEPPTSARRLIQS